MNTVRGQTAPDRWTPGGAFWEVGVAEVSDRVEIAASRGERPDG